MQIVKGNAREESAAMESQGPQSRGSPVSEVLVEQPQRINAVYMSPGCEHDWAAVEPERQTLASEGKTIWQCRGCNEITHTYAWQKP